MSSAQLRSLHLTVVIVGVFVRAIVFIVYGSAVVVVVVFCGLVTQIATFKTKIFALSNFKNLMSTFFLFP